MASGCAFHVVPSKARHWSGRSKWRQCARPRISPLSRRYTPRYLLASPSRSVRERSSMTIGGDLRVVFAPPSSPTMPSSCTRRS
eukprot:4787092-Prymnesium_polylepis.1